MYRWLGANCINRSYRWKKASCFRAVCVVTTCNNILTQINLDTYPQQSAVEIYNQSSNTENGFQVFLNQCKIKLCFCLQKTCFPFPIPKSKGYNSHKFRGLYISGNIHNYISFPNYLHVQIYMKFGMIVFTKLWWTNR